MSTRKVLFVTSSLDKGGAEQQLYHLVAGVSQTAEVRLVALQPGYYQQQFLELGVEVTVLPVRSWWSALQAARQLSYLLRAWQPDLIQSFLPHANMLIKLINLWHRRRWTVVTGVRNSQMRLWIWLAEYWTQAGASATVMNSATTKQIRVRRGFAERKLHVIPNGVKVDEQSAPYDFAKPTILTVAKMRPQKDYQTNLAAIAALAKRRSDFQVVYVGDGPERAEIEAAIEAHGLEEIVQLRGIRHDVPALMKGADVLFLPSLYEGQANVLIEAMHYELPIVMSEIPENLEVAEALVAPVGEAEQFATQLAKALSRRDQVVAQVAANKRTAAQFTVHHLQESYKELYDLLLSNRCSKDKGSMKSWSEHE